MLGGREQDHAPCLADRKRRLRVAGEEQSLDRDHVRLVERQQLINQRMDREQAFRHAGGRGSSMSTP